MSGASPPNLPNRPLLHTLSSLRLRAATATHTTFSLSLSLYLSLPFHDCRNATAATAAVAISLHFLLEVVLVRGPLARSSRSLANERARNAARSSVGDSLPFLLFRPCALPTLTFAPSLFVILPPPPLAMNVMRASLVQG